MAAEITLEKGLELKEILQKMNSGGLEMILQNNYTQDGSNGKAHVYEIRVNGSDYAVLKSYETFVSIWKYVGEEYHGEKYSTTTSKHQNKFKAEMERY